MIAEVEAMIKPDGMADNLGGNMKALVRQMSSLVAYTEYRIEFGCVLQTDLQIDNAQRRTVS